MAKKQTFESKLKKDVGDQFKMVKLVYSYQSAKSGSWRFAEKFVKVPLDANDQQFLDGQVKDGLALLEKLN